MNVINSDVINEIVIKNSRFICIIKSVKDEDEIKNIIDEYRNKYKDSTHVTYGWRIINKQKYSDDGEPGGTAGMPILNVLESNNLNYILCIVVRYFGGIKLGAGGLVRAYTKSVTLALENCNIIDIKEGYKIEIVFDYENSKVIDILLKNEIILNKEFNDVIKYEIIVNKEHYDIISKLEIGCIRVSIMDLIKY